MKYHIEFNIRSAGIDVYTNTGETVFTVKFPVWQSSWYKFKLESMDLDNRNAVRKMIIQDEPENLKLWQHLHDMINGSKP